MFIYGRMVNLCVRNFTHTLSYIHTYIYQHGFVCECACVCTRVRVYVCVYVCAHVFVQTHVHTQHTLNLPFLVQLPAGSGELCDIICKYLCIHNIRNCIIFAYICIFITYVAIYCIHNTRGCMRCIRRHRSIEGVYVYVYDICGQEGGRANE